MVGDLGKTGIGASVCRREDLRLLTGGGRYGPSAQVEYRAPHGLSLISQVGGEAGAKLAVRWRHDYGHSTDASAKKKP